MSKRDFLPHKANTMTDWDLEEARLRRKMVRAIVLIVLAGGLFALILCDIFGAFGECSIFVKIITAITTFMAFIKGCFDVFNVYINLHKK